MKIQVETLTFQNPKNAWVVLKVRDLKTNLCFAAVGNLPEVHVGEVLLIFGKWSVHKSYGKQFLIERAVAAQPTEKEDIIRYLSSGVFKGVGPKTAHKIVKHFGKETLKVLEESPERLKRIPKFSKKTANKLIRSWEMKKQNSEALQFLMHHGVSLNASQKIVELYGAQTVSKISENPYCLMKHVKGFGFIRADQIAKSMGIQEETPLRVEYALRYALSVAEDNGHCFQSQEQLYSFLSKSLGISNSQIIEDSLETLQNQGFLYGVSGSEESLSYGEGKLFYLSELYEAERQVATSLQEIAESSLSSIEKESDLFEKRVMKWLEKFSELSQRELSDQQKYSVLSAVTSKVFILTGGPGVGKTTTANAIIHLFKAMKKRILLAAPTGRAAQRMSEVSSVPAKTIHRMLEWNSEVGGFQRSIENPLDADVVIIDESSMLDIRLADALLQAVPRRAQIIFIGDKDQLAPVGAGNFFRDLIDSQQISIQKLDKVFRQAQTSQIISIAHNINKGLPSRFQNAEKDDCFFFELDSDEDILTRLELLVSKELGGAGYDPLHDVQILSPMNKGPLGCHNLNERLQSVLNPRVNKKLKDRVFEVGDKVIQTANNYELSIYNGDIGYVESISEEKVPIIRFGERFVKYTSDQSNDLKLAYAITIHKSQGSEFPVVIIPMSMGHFMMLQRNLLYTGLTRGKKLAIFLGSSKAFHIATKNQSSEQRQTRLKEILRKDLGLPYHLESFVDSFEEGVGS